MAAYDYKTQFIVDNTRWMSPDQFDRFLDKTAGVTDTETVTRVRKINARRARKQK